ncbi:MAG: hydrolase [Victivallales bacterium]|nr:hydrolase [Victivallales bacterium]
MAHIPTRDDAWQLVVAHTESEALVNHYLAVEAVMRRLARKYGQDEEEWGAIGLVHDLDWERWPDEHCRKTRELLEAADWPAEYIRAVEAHGWGLCTDVEPLTTLENCLYAIDELTGLVTACALVRPSRSVLDLKVKSVKKKWKNANFAAGANREVIQQGADRLGVELTDLIEDVIAGMREVAEEIGLGARTGPTE